MDNHRKYLIHCIVLRVRWEGIKVCPNNLVTKVAMTKHTPKTLFILISTKSIMHEMITKNRSTIL